MHSCNLSSLTSNHPQPVIQSRAYHCWKAERTLVIMYFQNVLISHCRPCDRANANFYLSCKPFIHPRALVSDCNQIIWNRQKRESPLVMTLVQLRWKSNKVLKFVVSEVNVYEDVFFLLICNHSTILYSKKFRLWPVNPRVCMFMGFFLYSYFLI